MSQGKNCGGRVWGRSSESVLLTFSEKGEKTHTHSFSAFDHRPHHPLLSMYASSGLSGCPEIPQEQIPLTNPAVCTLGPLGPIRHIVARVIFLPSGTNPCPTLKHTPVFPQLSGLSPSAQVCSLMSYLTSLPLTTPTP